MKVISPCWTARGKRNLTSVRTQRSRLVSSSIILYAFVSMPRMKTNRYVPVCFKSTLGDKCRSSLMRLYEVTVMQEFNPTSTTFSLDPELCVVTVSIESAGWLKRGAKLLNSRMRSGAMSCNDMEQRVSKVIRWDDWARTQSQLHSLTLFYGGLHQVTTELSLRWLSSQFAWVSQHLLSSSSQPGTQS